MCPKLCISLNISVVETTFSISLSACHLTPYTFDLAGTSPHLLESQFYLGILKMRMSWIEHYIACLVTHTQYYNLSL